MRKKHPLQSLGELGRLRAWITLGFSDGTYRLVVATPGLETVVVRRPDLEEAIVEASESVNSQLKKLDPKQEWRIRNGREVGNRTGEGP